MIFHSYVSLPEGNFDHLSIPLAVCTLYIPFANPQFTTSQPLGGKSWVFLGVAIQLPLDSAVKKMHENALSPTMAKIHLPCGLGEFNFYLLVSDLLHYWITVTICGRIGRSFVESGEGPNCGSCFGCINTISLEQPG